MQKGGLVIPSDVAFIIQSFLCDADRKNSEQVSLNFHTACNTLERLEFRDRLQNVELKLIKEKFSKSSIASSPKRVFSSEEGSIDKDSSSGSSIENIEKEIEEFESKHMKIPFHLKEYLRMSVHLDPYLILDLLKEYVFMHPLTVLCSIGDWSVIKQGEEYLIGEFSNTTGDDIFVFTLKKLDNYGKCSIFMSITKTNKYGDDQETNYSTTRCLEIGTLKRWFNNYGFGWFLNRNVFHYSFYNALQRNHLDLHRISKNDFSSSLAGFNHRHQHIHNVIKNYKFVSPGTGLIENFSLDLLREKLITLNKLKPPEMRNNPRIIEMAVRCNGLNLEFVSKEYHRNEDIVRMAVSQNGLALKFASKDLRMNRSIVEIACTQNRYALRYSLLSREHEDHPKQSVVARLKEYFALNNQIHQSIDNVFPNDEYIQRSIYSFGLEYLTPFQIDLIRKCEQVEENGNILFQAPTVGKTVASLIVAMQRIQRFKSKLGSGIHCIVLCPNRELVKVIERLAICMMNQQQQDYHIIATHGGHLHNYYFYNHEKYTVCTPMEVDFSTNTELSPKPSILIGTPGRVADDIRSGLIQLNKAHTIIYEEADILLNGEYQHEMKYVMREIEEYRPICKLLNIVLCQTLTESLYFRMNLLFNQELEYFYRDEKHALFNPMLLLKECIDHELVDATDENERDSIHYLASTLLKQCTEGKDGMAVLFGNRMGLESVRDILNDSNVPTALLHSDMDQKTREFVLTNTNSTNCRVFSTTDVNTNALTFMSNQVHTIFQLNFPSSEEIFCKRIRHALSIQTTTRLSKLKVITMITSKNQEKRILKWLR